MNAVWNNKLTVVIVAADKPAIYVMTDEQTPIADLQPGEYQLVPGEILNVARVGQRLRIVSGCAWITFDGEDMVLLAGQEMVLKPGEDTTVVSALDGKPLVYRIYDAPNVN